MLALELLGSALVSAVLSWILVAVVRRHALQREILDRPTDRSSHTVPVARGGGLGLTAAFLLTFCGWAGFHHSLSWRVAVALAAVVLTALIGWKDDHGGLPVTPRLLGHLVAGMMLLPLVLSPEPVPVWLGGGAVLWWLFWMVSAVNVVNFIDGIDGMIALQALVYAAHLVVLGDSADLARAYGFALGGAAIGFLLWNWAPARIFLGDVGSGALGSAFVLGGLILMRERQVSLVAAYLPLYPIFLDASVTLIRRAVRGEVLTTAHRTHLYQELANGRWGHARVSALYGFVSLVGTVLVCSQLAPQGVTMAGYFVSVPVLGFFLQRAGRHAGGPR